MKQAWWALVFVLAACRSTPSDERLIEMSVAAEKADAAGRSAGHTGPGVTAKPTGPARFAPRVFEGFSAERALEATSFADRWYREPANEGFEAVIDHVVSELRAAGFGSSENRTLEVIETPMETPAWTPKSARLELVEPKRTRVLHSFSKPEDRDRTMLPRNAPAAERVEGRLVTTVGALEPGCALLTDGALSAQLLADAKEHGAVLVIAADLADFNVDPKEKGQRHLDAIGYRHVAYPPVLPVVQVSPRTATTLREAVEKQRETRVRFTCNVTFAERPLRTVVATLVGATHPEECVALAAHVQEPGACDNASGVGTLLEAARYAAQATMKNDLEVPSRSVCFVFGDEMAQSRIFLDHTQRRCIAGLAADMTGESGPETTAHALLERTPDPGALKALPPDRHTDWTKEEVTADRSEISPNGLAVIARCSLFDVAVLSKGWKTEEHPYEGGSDHSVFLRRGVPSVLFWHFTDWAYHTNLDRLDHVDAGEMRRMGTALLSTALAVADARPADLERYLDTLLHESQLRQKAAKDAGDPELEQDWRKWTNGARLWLRTLCLGTEVQKPAPKREP